MRSHIEKLANYFENNKELYLQIKKLASVLPSEKVAIFLAGLPGSGKSFLVEDICKSEEFVSCLSPDDVIFPLFERAKALDDGLSYSDFFENHFPATILSKEEKRKYLEDSDLLDMVEEEEIDYALPETMYQYATEIRNNAFENAIENEKNIIWDGTGRGYYTYNRGVKTLNKNGYKVFLLYVVVPKTVALERCLQRQRETGRSVPRNFIDLCESKLDKNIKSFYDVFDGNIIVYSSSDKYYEKEQVIDDINLNIPESNIFLKEDLSSLKSYISNIIMG